MSAGMKDNPSDSFSRACCFACGATASSRSMITASGPAEAAFANLSARSPGTNRGSVILAISLCIGLSGSPLVQLDDAEPGV